MVSWIFSRTCTCRFFLNLKILDKLNFFEQVRKNLFGQKDASYSGYTCYTGIADFVPADIESVGYVLFLAEPYF